MTVSININGQLVLDQTAGLQTGLDGDDVAVGVTVNAGPDNDVLTGSLDTTFLAFLNAIPAAQLSDTQKNFAGLVEGALQENLIQVTADAGETIGKLFFSDASGNDLDGDQVFLNDGVTPMTTIEGDPIYLWSMMNGKVVIATTSAVDAFSGSLVAAFYMESNDATNTAAKVESVTFIALAHPDDTNPDDSVDFSDILRVSAVITSNAPVGDNIIVDDDGPTIVTTGEAPTLPVDETDLTTDATANFAANFDGAFGTDGGGEIVYALGISAPDADSGLVDTATGDAILLRIDGDGNVEGYLAGDPTVVAFEVTLDEATAEATLDQLRAVVHPDDTDHDDDVTLASADLITVTGTITDADDDSDEAVLNIGQLLTFGDDGPSIIADGTIPTLTVDETDLTTDDSADFSGVFTPTGGADGNAGVGYTLDVSADGADSGLVDTATGDSILLREDVDGNVEGYLANDDTVVAFEVSVDDNGNVSLDQLRAVVHPDDTDPDDSVTLASDDLVTLTATITDGDGDTAEAVANIGTDLNFEDDGPSIETTGDNPIITVDETALGIAATGDFAPNFSGLFGADGEGDIDFDLDVTAAVIAGLQDTQTGEAINIAKVGDDVVATTAIGGLTVFTVSVDADGVVSLLQARSVFHTDDTDPDDPRTIGAADLVTLTATITDGDGDTQQATLNIGDSLVVDDDGPTVEVPVTYVDDPRTPGVDAQALLGNAAGQSVTNAFGYDIGADDRLDAFYALGGSDFVDADPVRAGVQLSMSATTSSTGDATNEIIDLVSEDADSALFNWSFDYDKDPNAAGVQLGTATGTLLFDKDDDTFTFTTTAPVQGFSTTVLKTSDFLAKAPPGNTGHPEIVVERLSVDNPATPQDEDFYVQFTGNNSPFSFSNNGEGSTADTAFNGNNHDMVTSANETWVSATQSTNGVAGDTIQKGEALTLRFFNTDILGDVNPNAPGGGTEKLTPTATADGIVLKFDGIGNNEDLMVVLDLIDKDGADNILGNGDDNATMTKAIRIDNADFYKSDGNALTDTDLPEGYRGDFNFEEGSGNNDAVAIIEKNDFNTGTENWEIQGVQIMQSANGLTGTAINLNRDVGPLGGSSGTQAWDTLDNDVLKIIDIGFLQAEFGSQSATMEVEFNVADGDQDLLGIQQLQVNIANDWIV